MNLKRILNKDCVRINFPGATKDEIISGMVDLVVSAHKLGDRRDEILQSVFDRESKMSTGMKNGIGIPHGKTDAVKEMYSCIVVSASPVDFESLDDKPCRIFIMTISPLSTSGPHLQFLAEVSDLLKRPELREEILAAASDEVLFQILTK